MLVKIGKYNGNRNSGNIYTRVILTENYHISGMKSFRDDLIDRMKTGWGRFVLASNKYGSGLMYITRITDNRRCSYTVKMTCSITDMASWPQKKTALRSSQHRSMFRVIRNFCAALLSSEIRIP
jgi:hypothetical protein